jgi:hypothetical protein
MDEINKFYDSDHDISDSFNEFISLENLSYVNQYIDNQVESQAININSSIQCELEKISLEELKIINRRSPNKFKTQPEKNIQKKQSMKIKSLAHYDEIAQQKSEEEFKKKAEIKRIYNKTFRNKKKIIEKSRNDEITPVNFENPNQNLLHKNNESGNENQEKYEYQKGKNRNRLFFYI